MLARAEVDVPSFESLMASSLSKLGCMCQPFSSKIMLTNTTTDKFERRARNDRAMSNALRSVLVPQHTGNKKAATPIDLGLLT